MNGLDIFFVSFIIGLVSNYILDLKYLKYLRGESNSKITDSAVILTSIIWGTPVILFMYCIFREIRFEDAAHKRRLLISCLIILALQIVAVVLLCYFDLLTLPPVVEEGSDTLQKVFSLL